MVRLSPVLINFLPLQLVSQEYVEHNKKKTGTFLSCLDKEFNVLNTLLFQMDCFICEDKKLLLFFS